MKDLPILITGAGGMLGSHLAEALRRDGYTNLTLASRKHFETDLKLEIGDLKDWNFLLRIIEGKHTIIHAASKISYSDLDFDTLMVENTLVMRSMIDLALEYDVPNFIYISSTSTLFNWRICSSL
jgi:nucleoside-diphosphate-sugar epimerase